MSQEISSVFTHIIKRDGGIKAFDAAKIAHALTRAAQVTGEFDAAEATRLTQYLVLPTIKVHGEVAPHIEQIQDAVEAALFDAAYPKTLRAYIVYREQHKKLRNDRKTMVDVESSMNEYLEQRDWRVNANAN
jgi:anaerobic ribonucleoside-triphosphate reductase